MPTAFAALEVLAFPYALAVVVLMTVVTSSTGWLRITDGFDPTLVPWPIGIALVTVFAYRTLEQESLTSQRLLDELVAAHEDLAAAQHGRVPWPSGTRLSRGIHDSVGQGLSSINLLLNAAEQDWDRRPDAPGRTSDRGRLGPFRAGRGAPGRPQPRSRRDRRPGRGRRAARRLSRIAAQTGSSTAVEVRVHGAPTGVPEDVATAIVRTTSGALANVTEHSAARHAVISLTYNSDEVLLDVRDDGTGMDPAAVGPPGCEDADSGGSPNEPRASVDAPRSRAHPARNDGLGGVLPRRSGSGVASSGSCSSTTPSSERASGPSSTGTTTSPSSVRPTTWPARSASWPSKSPTSS